MSEPTILTQFDPRGVLTITLNRPAARNALDEAAIAALTAICEGTAGRTDVRAVVLRGAGPAFCAGADIGWMERLAASDDAANRADARALARMLRALDGLPQPLIGCVHGPAIGGGVGLVAACDAVLASADAFFQFSEARIGLAPATIAPIVARRIGTSQAAYLFLTARRFGALRAETLGLVHEIVPTPADLDAALERLILDVLAGGPSALATIKRMVRGLAPAASPDDMADLLATTRASDEAREGFAAFREKRPPSWRPEN